MGGRQGPEEGEGEGRREGEDGAEVATKVRPKTRAREKLEKPKLYRVLLHNDDYTTREFVVMLLRTVFNKGETEAVQIMLHVHYNGIGLAGVYPFEVAETKVATSLALARENEYPLLCTLEPE